MTENTYVSVNFQTVLGSPVCRAKVHRFSHIIQLLNAALTHLFIIYQRTIYTEIQSKFKVLVKLSSLASSEEGEEHDVCEAKTIANFLTPNVSMMILLPSP